jgi:hypothetical protein
MTVVRIVSLQTEILIGTETVILGPHLERLWSPFKRAASLNPLTFAPVVMETVHHFRLFELAEKTRNWSSGLSFRFNCSRLSPGCWRYRA